MKVLPLLALAVLTLLLPGCATQGGGMAGGSSDRRIFLLTAAMRETPCRSELRLCTEKNTFSRQRFHGFKNIFAQATTDGVPTDGSCDISMTFPSAWSNDGDAFVASTGKFIARFKLSHVSSPNGVCNAFSPDGDLIAQLPGHKKRAPAVAAGASSQGMSAEDIEKLAAALRGQQAPAPAAASAASFPASPAPRFAAAERPDDLAVIVGIEAYSDIASKAPYAERDADAFKSYVRALGVPERNIVLLKGPKAGKASLEKNLEAWLPRMVKPTSRVYFYFSGHGAPDVKTGQAYLVPWDGDPNFLEETAYPVAQLYQKLGALPAKQVLVAMDSCFSGAGGRSVLASGARPLVGKIDTGTASGKVTVLAASASNEISGSLDDKGHGAFTYFLLEGLNAGKTTPKALNEYLTPRVQDEARRLNRDQTPQLQGDGAWSLR